MESDKCRCGYLALGPFVWGRRKTQVQAKRFAYRKQDPKLMKETFRAMRGNFVALAKSATPQDLARRGVHPD